MALALLLLAGAGAEAISSSHRSSFVTPHLSAPGPVTDFRAPAGAHADSFQAATASPATDNEPLPALLQLAVIQSRARDADPEYRIDAGGQGANPRHGLTLEFTPEGALIAQTTDHSSATRYSEFALRLERFGRGDGQPVSRIAPAIDNAWVEYDRGPGLTEWFVNLPEGVEQGWTLTERPAGVGPLVLELDTGRAPDRADSGLRNVNSSVIPANAGIRSNDQRSTDNGQFVFSDLVYHGLTALDAEGRTLPAHWTHDGTRLRIEVDDTAAVYPILIDPFVQTAKLTASDGAEGDQLGASVALEGDTALVGANFADPGGNASQGAAYVFTRSGDVWSEQAKLTASDGAAGDQFGISVALAGDTALVGASFADPGGIADQGAAYVFVRSSGIWSEQAKLTAPDGVAQDQFGISVALSGDTALIGAILADPGGTANQGAAYVFVRGGDVWSEQAKLTASGGAAGDQFGFSVALSGDTALVGANLADPGGITNRGASWVFTRSGGVWTEQAKLTASDGALGDNFGFSVALSGDTALVGANFADPGGINNQGAAYAFTRNGDIWSEQAKLVASDGAANDLFGRAVALSGDTALVGANGADPGGILNQGAAWIFTRSGEVWSERTKLTATDGANGDRDQFGWSVALEGDAVLVGARQPFLGPGAAYVFEDLDVVAIADITPDAFDFEVEEHASATQTLDIGNLGTGPLNWSIAEAHPLGGGGDCASPVDVPWLSVSPTSGTTPPEDGTPVEVTVDTTDLAIAEFQAQLCVTTNDLNAPLVAIPVRLTVIPGTGPEFAVAPENLMSIRFPDEMETQPLTLANPGEETLEWAVTEEDMAGGFASITQSVGGNIQSPDNTFACSPDGGATTPANRFLRTFKLTDSGVFTPFNVAVVQFGIENLSAPAPITVNLYTLEGAFVFDNLTLLGSVTQSLSAQQLTLVTVLTGAVNATVPAGAILVVEIAAPDLSGTAAFIPGSNTLGETAPSYFSSDACGITEPASFAEIGIPGVHLVMNVLGSFGPLECALPDWADAVPVGGSVPAGMEQGVDVTFDAAGLLPGDFSANLCLASNAPANPLRVVPLTLTVTDTGLAKLAFDPADLDFGDVELGGTSPAQSATLRNTGNAMATGLAFNTPGVGFDADTGDCGASLAPGASCEVNVTFTPAFPGAAGAALEVSSDQGVSDDLLLAANGVPPNAWVQTEKLTTPTFESLFGFQVALSGDTVLVGGLGPAATVFTRSGEVWIEQARFTVSDGPAEDFFGVSVALAGDTALVSALQRSAVFVFTRSGEVWTEQARLTASDGVSGDNFGWSAALSEDGDTALVGANLADPGGNEDQGAAYVFTRSGEVWTEQAKLTASDGAEGDQLGASVALVGDTALVGANFADPGGITDQGAAYVFTRNGGVWSEQARLTAFDGAAEDNFGFSVALSGDTALVGANGADPGGTENQGAAYVFIRSGAIWSQQAKLIASDGAMRNFFGQDVALVGDTALVGAPQAQVGSAIQAGAVYVFTRGSGIWKERTKLTSLQPLPGAIFGTSVVLSDDARTAVLGAPAVFFGGPEPSSFVFVNVPADVGDIQGAVQSLGSCGDQSVPLAGASVEIAGAENPVVIETNADGLYRIFLSDSESPVDITVTAPGHLPVAVEDIEFSGGDIVTQDFDLVLNQPCLELQPESLTETLSRDQTTTRILELANTGAAALDWAITDDAGVVGSILRPNGTATIPATGGSPVAVEGFAPATGVQNGTIASHPFQLPSGDQLTITHSDSLDILAGNTAACLPNGTNTSENRFLRTFTLTDFGLSSVDVTEVTFGIEALNAATPITVTVNLYTLEGAFIFSNLTLIGSATQGFSAQSLSLVTVPVTGTAQAGATLVVEIVAPDLSGVGSFFAGSNNLGETAPSFIAASACGIVEPTPFADVDFPNTHLVMTVTGIIEPLDCTLPGWMSAAPLSGSIGAGSSQDLNVAFDATGLDPGDFAASLCLTSNDPANQPRVIPVSLTVLESAIATTPQAINFGTVTIGASGGPASVTLASTGEGLVMINSISSPGGAFTQSGGSCAAPPFSLDAGTSCTLEYTFTPPSAGNFSAIVTIDSNADTIGVALTGTGTDMEPPVDEIFRDQFEENP